MKSQISWSRVASSNLAGSSNPNRKVRVFPLLQNGSDPVNQQNFRKGLLDGLPIGLGYLSVSFAFGIFAVSSGLSAAEASFVSMTCMTSAGQLAAVPIMTGGGSLIELVIAQVIINLRYSLMSISLSQKLGEDVTAADRFAIAFFNTDEIFAVASSQPGQVSRVYMYGLGVLPWVGWAGGTIAGALAGNILPAMVTSALGVAIYGMFIAIVVPVARQERPVALCVLMAVALSCAFEFLPMLRQIPGGFTVILCAVAASAVMAILAPVKEVEA